MNDELNNTGERSLDPDILQKLSADVADDSEDACLRKWADLTGLPKIHREQLDLDTVEFLRALGFTTWTVNSWTKFLAKYPLVIKLVPAGREGVMTIPHFRAELANGSDARPVVLLLINGEAAVFLADGVVNHVATQSAATFFRPLLEDYYLACQQAYSHQQQRLSGVVG